MSDSEETAGFFATQILQNQPQQQKQPQGQINNQEGQTQDVQPQEQSTKNEQPPQEGEKQNQEVKKSEPQKQAPKYPLKHLLEVFNSYDKSQKGLIGLEECQVIVGDKLGPRQTLSQEIAFYHHLSMPSQDLKCTFDEFLFIFSMYEKQLQNREIDEQYEYAKQAQARLIDFMRLLNNYRKKCEKETSYQEAKKSKSKVEEIREKEYNRRKNYLNLLHEQELISLEERQKEKFSQFCQTWDEFMREYEITAADLVQKLTARHEEETQKFILKTKEELASKVHFSKQIIELQALEKNLVKAQEYDKAEKVKEEIAQTKHFELEKKERDDLLKLELKVDALKKQQGSSMNTLLQKIQKDRNDQTRQRLSDSQKLIVKNKTLVNELRHRHNDCLKKLYEALHNFSLEEPNLHRVSTTLSAGRANHNPNNRQNVSGFSIYDQQNKIKQ